jgi:hypothetical protein
MPADVLAWSKAQYSSRPESPSHQSITRDRLRDRTGQRLPRLHRNRRGGRRCRCSKRHQGHAVRGCTSSRRTIRYQQRPGLPPALPVRLAHVVPTPHRCAVGVPATQRTP